MISSRLARSAGIYVPMLAEQIMQRGGSGINLKGLMVGNGCWGNEVGSCSNAMWVGDQQRLVVDVIAGHGLVSRQLYREIGSACNFSWNGDVAPDQGCLDMLMAVHNQSGIRLHAPTYNIYDFCRSGIGTGDGYVAPRPPDNGGDNSGDDDAGKGPSPRLLRQSELLAAHWAASPLAHHGSRHDTQTTGSVLTAPAAAAAGAGGGGGQQQMDANGDEQRWCGSGTSAVVWQSIPVVAAAMHVNLSNGCDVPAASTTFRPRRTTATTPIDDDDADDGDDDTEGDGSQRLLPPPPANKCLKEYNRTPAGDLRPLYATLAKRYDVLLYSGDADSCVPFVGTEEWVHGLGFPVKEHWRPWLSLANTTGPIGKNGVCLTLQRSNATRMHAAVCTVVQSCNQLRLDLVESARFIYQDELWTAAAGLNKQLAKQSP
jgi:hypothetical protein